MFTGVKNIRRSKQIGLKIAYAIVLLFTFFAIFASLIANERPIYIENQGKSSWPIFTSANWEFNCSEQTCTRRYTLIPFSPSTIDASSIYAPPGEKSEEYGYRHLLGSDELGRDVLAAIIHGSRTALLISGLAAFLALVMGLLYGMILGYYGDDRLGFSSYQLIGFMIISILVFFLFAFTRNLCLGMYISPRNFILIGFILLMLYLTGIYQLKYIRSKGKSIQLRLDDVGMRLIDLVKALPALFIVLFVLQIVEGQAVTTLVLLIAFLLWAPITRHARAETIRLRENPAIQSAILSGRSDMYIMRHHVLPFIVRPLFVTLSFSMAGAILLEATLSFLGLGLPVDHVSWGTMINAARTESSAWWLLVFPGICMLLLIWSFQHIGRSVEIRMRKEANVLETDHG